MDLVKRIREELTKSLKESDSLKAETLRGLLSSVHNAEIDDRSRGGDGKLSEVDVVKVLQKEAKKRREAAELYSGAGRKELEEKELSELDVISGYLPSPLERSEVEAIVKDVIESGSKDFGVVMKLVMEKVAGRAEAKIVSEIVREHLG